MDQGSTENHSPVNNYDPIIMKFCLVGLSLPHLTKFCNFYGEIGDS